MRTPDRSLPSNRHRRTICRPSTPPAKSTEPGDRTGLSHFCRLNAARFVVEIVKWHGRNCTYFRASNGGLYRIRNLDKIGYRVEDVAV
jgi:hypothetical protein